MAKKSKDKKKDKTKGQVDELKNQLARALADYANLQKRVDKEREEIVKLSNITLFARLAPVFDMLYQAQRHLNDDGLDHVLSELEKALEEEGIVKVEAEKDMEFNENLHEAIETEPAPSKKNEGKISEVLLKGWEKDGVIIRPAKVKVFVKNNN